MVTPAHEMADEFEPDYRRTFLEMVESLRDVAPDRLEEMLDAGDRYGIMGLWERNAAEVLPQHFNAFGVVYRGVVVGTGEQSMLSGVVFDPETIRIARVLTRRAGSLVTGVSKESMQGIRTILSSEAVQGYDARHVARLLRDVVGVLPKHAQAVASYAQGLRDQGFNPAYVTRLASIYERRLLMYRTENIARTEMMVAANWGQQEAWEQMIERGYLQDRRTWKEWVVTEDDRLCPVCAPMDGQRVRVSEMFTSTVRGFPDGVPTDLSSITRRSRRGPIRPDPLSGQPRDERGRFVSRMAKRRDVSVLRELKRPKSVLHPPLHPSCRCAVVLRFED